MSGFPARSDRTPDLAVQALRTQIDTALSPTDWQALIRKVFELAMRGNLSAARLLLQYRYGPPAAQVEPAAAQARQGPGLYLPLREDEPVPDLLGVPAESLDFPGDAEFWLGLARETRALRLRRARAYYSAHPAEVTPAIAAALAGQTDPPITPCDWEAYNARMRKYAAATASRSTPSPPSPPTAIPASAQQSSA
jgi:hypothetical protein